MLVFKELHVQHVCLGEHEEKYFQKKILAKKVSSPVGNASKCNHPLMLSLVKIIRIIIVVCYYDWLSAFETKIRPGYDVVQINISLTDILNDSVNIRLNQGNEEFITMCISVYSDR